MWILALVLCSMISLSTRAETVRDEMTTKSEKYKIISLDTRLGQWIEYQEKQEREIRSAKQSEFIVKKNSINAKTRKEWFLEYKRLRQEYAEWLNLRPTLYDRFTAEEIYLMQRCVETECHDRSFESKVNVACVIFNRIAHKGFPNNVTEVIMTKRQFAYALTNINEETILALEYAFLFNELSPDILFFHSKEWTPTFCGAIYSFSDDAVHHFYKVN